MNRVKQRVESIDLLRGIAAVLVILGHSFIEYPVNVTNIAWCSKIDHVIYTFHMELFFLLAGMVYKCGEYRTYIKRKSIRILIPYVFFGMVTLLFKSFGGGFVNGNVSIKDGIWKFLVNGGEYWFLYVMFLVLAVYPFVNKCLHRTWMKIVLVGILMIVHTYVKLPNFLCLSALIKYFPYFVVGNVIANQVEPQDMERLSITKLYGGITALIFYVITDKILVNYGDVVFLEYIRGMAMCYVAYYAVLWVLKTSREHEFMKRIKTFLKLCSDYSLQLYLFNGYILVLLRVLLCNVLGINSPMVIVSVIWLGNIVITLIACIKIIPHITFARKLCGL